MKVKATIDFCDRENNLKFRKRGEFFEVKEERAKKLLALGYVEIAEEAKTVAE